MSCATCIQIISWLPKQAGQGFSTSSGSCSQCNGLTRATSEQQFGFKAARWKVVFVTVVVVISIELAQAAMLACGPPPERPSPSISSHCDRGDPNILIQAALSVSRIFETRDGFAIGGFRSPSVLV